MKKALAATLVLVAATLFAIASSYAVDILPTADVPTDSGHPNQNWDNYYNSTYASLDRELWTGTWYIGRSNQKTNTYLKFDLSAFSNIQSAKLWLYNAPNSDDVGGSDYASAAVNCYYVSDDSWSETGVTWNNQSALTGSFVSTTVNNTIGWYSWDVTSFAQTNGASLFSLGLNSPGHGHSYYARETLTNFKPYLSVTTAPEPVSSALFLMGGIALAGRHLRRKARKV